MIKIEFENPLTAFEVREPFIEGCKSVAEELNLHATFHQPMQRALSGWPGEHNRKRIGNGKHKNWYIDYQEEEPSHNRPTVLGRVALFSATIPETMQFGGFDYGKYGEVAPTYDFVTVELPSDLQAYKPVIPTAEMIELTYQALRERYSNPS